MNTHDLGIPWIWLWLGVGVSVVGVSLTSLGTLLFRRRSPWGLKRAVPRWLSLAGWIHYAPLAHD